MIDPNSLQFDNGFFVYEYTDENGVIQQRRIIYPRCNNLPSGIAGDQGPDGDKGPTGDQGPDGNKGLMGDKGLDGDQGPDGNRGPDGNKGPIGDQGPDGDKGPIGDQGPVGEQEATIDDFFTENWTFEQLSLTGRVFNQANPSEFWGDMSVILDSVLVNEASWDVLFTALLTSDTLFQNATVLRIETGLWNGETGANSRVVVGKTNDITFQPGDSVYVGSSFKYEDKRDPQGRSNRFTGLMFPYIEITHISGDDFSFEDGSFNIKMEPRQNLRFANLTDQISLEQIPNDIISTLKLEDRAVTEAKVDTVLLNKIENSDRYHFGFLSISTDFNTAFEDDRNEISIRPFSSEAFTNFPAEAEEGQNILYSGSYRGVQDSYNGEIWQLLFNLKTGRVFYRNQTSDDLNIPDEITESWSVLFEPAERGSGGGAEAFSDLMGMINTNQIPANAITLVKLAQEVRNMFSEGGGASAESIDARLLSYTENDEVLDSDSLLLKQPNSQTNYGLRSNEDFVSDNNADQFGMLFNNGITLWVMETNRGFKAFNIATKQRDSEKDFALDSQPFSAGQLLRSSVAFDVDDPTKVWYLDRNSNSNLLKTFTFPASFPVSQPVATTTVQIFDSGIDYSGIENTTEHLYIINRDSRVLECRRKDNFARVPARDIDIQQAGFIGSVELVEDKVYISERTTSDRSLHVWDLETKERLNNLDFSYAGLGLNASSSHYKNKFWLANQDNRVYEFLIDRVFLHQVNKKTLENSIPRRLPVNTDRPSAEEFTSKRLALLDRNLRITSRDPGNDLQVVFTEIDPTASDSNATFLGVVNDYFRFGSRHTLTAGSVVYDSGRHHFYEWVSAGAGWRIYTPNPAVNVLGVYTDETHAKAHITANNQVVGYDGKLYRTSNYVAAVAPFYIWDKLPEIKTLEAKAEEAETDTVKYTPQENSTARRAQARANIGAASLTAQAVIPEGTALNLENSELFYQGGNQVNHQTRENLVYIEIPPEAGPNFEVLVSVAGSNNGTGIGYFGYTILDQGGGTHGSLLSQGGDVDFGDGFFAEGFELTQDHAFTTPTGSTNPNLQAGKRYILLNFFNTTQPHATLPAMNFIWSIISFPDDRLHVNGDFELVRNFEIPIDTDTKSLHLFDGGREIDLRLYKYLRFVLNFHSTNPTIKSLRLSTTDILNYCFANSRNPPAHQNDGQIFLVSDYQSRNGSVRIGRGNDAYGNLSIPVTTYGLQLRRKANELNVIDGWWDTLSTRQAHNSRGFISIFGER